MIPKLIRTITGGIGLAIMMVFIIGLAHSISIGFVGTMITRHASCADIHPRSRSRPC